MTERFKLTVPEFGEGNHEVVVRHWCFAEGDYVDQGVSLVELASPTFGVDLPAPRNAVLEKIFVKNGETASRDMVLAELVAVDAPLNDTLKPPPLAKPEPLPRNAVATADRPVRWFTAELAMSGIEACLNVHQKNANGTGFEPLPFLTNALAQCLVLSTTLNATVSNGRSNTNNRVDLRTVLLFEGRPAVLLLEDCERRTIAETDAIVRKRVASGDLAEITDGGGTFTLHFNLAPGLMLSDAPLATSQVAALSISGLGKRSVVTEREGEYLTAIRTMANICLTYDPCFVGFSQAANFLREFKGIAESYSGTTDIG